MFAFADPDPKEDAVDAKRTSSTSKKNVSSSASPSSRPSPATPTSETPRRVRRSPRVASAQRGMTPAGSVRALSRRSSARRDGKSIPGVKTTSSSPRNETAFLRAAIARNRGHDPSASLSCFKSKRSFGVCALTSRCVRFGKNPTDDAGSSRKGDSSDAFFLTAEKEKIALFETSNFSSEGSFPSSANARGPRAFERAFRTVRDAKHGPVSMLGKGTRNVSSTALQQTSKRLTFRSVAAIADTSDEEKKFSGATNRSRNGATRRNAFSSTESYARSVASTNVTSFGSDPPTSANRASNVRGLLLLLWVFFALETFPSSAAASAAASAE